MCCSAFSPEKNKGKRGFNVMVVNGKLFISKFFSENKEQLWISVIFH